MKVEEADKQAEELLRLCRDKAPNQIKIGAMNIVNVQKFLDTHQSRLNFLTTFSREWKLNYLRVYLLKKKLDNEK